MEAQPLECQVCHTKSKYYADGEPTHIRLRQDRNQTLTHLCFRCGVAEQIEVLEERKRAVDKKLNLLKAAPPEPTSEEVAELAKMGIKW